MQPCIIQGVLAPTVKQRLGYKDWLHIYEKDLVLLSPRMAELHKKYEVGHCMSYYIYSF